MLQAGILLSIISFLFNVCHSSLIWAGQLLSRFPSVFQPSSISSPPFETVIIAMTEKFHFSCFSFVGARFRARQPDSVPQAIYCFLISKDEEDALKNCILQTLSVVCAERFRKRTTLMNIFRSLKTNIFTGWSTLMSLIYCDVSMVYSALRNS